MTDGTKPESGSPKLTPTSVACRALSGWPWPGL